MDTLEYTRQVLIKGTCDLCGDTEIERKDCKQCDGKGEIKEWVSLAEAVQSVIKFSVE